MSIPMNFEGLNQYNSQRSVAGRVQNDINTAYYMRSLYHRVISGITFNVPKEWNIGLRYFKNCLFIHGYIGVINTPKYGIIPQWGTPKGYGIFYQPTEFLVTSPHEGISGTYNIGENCEIIHLTNDWMGIWDIIEHYAIRLSTAITSVDVSLMNSRLSFLAAAKNKSAAEALKFLYEKISAGEPFAVYDKVLKSDALSEDDPIWNVTKDVANNYITDKLLNDIDTILKQFDAEIGIRAMNGKKERMLTSEVDALNEDAVARSMSWKDCMDDSIKLVNELYPTLNLSYKMRYGGEDHEYISETNVNRDV